MTGYMDSLFSHTGFTNWKKAVDRFNKHDQSASHRNTVSMVLAASKASTDVGLQMSKDYKEKQAQNRKCLLAIVSTVRFLARQGLPLRGASRGDSSGSGEINSNFMQLLIPDLDAWLEKSQDQFTSPDIQNEFLQIMTLTVLRGITERLTDRYFSIMVDETTDISNVEQLVHVLHSVC